MLFVYKNMIVANQFPLNPVLIKWYKILLYENVKYRANNRSCQINSLQSPHQKLLVTMSSNCHKRMSRIAISGPWAEASGTA